MIEINVIWGYGPYFGFVTGISLILLIRYLRQFFW